MNRIVAHVALALLCGFATTATADWPQGGGPSGHYSATGDVPVQWSVAKNQGIRWAKTLDEGGQSTVVVSGDRIFFTTNSPVQSDSQLGSDIVAYCCDRKTGDTIWTQTIAAKYPLRLSGCFSDCSSPPAATDGQHVCFFNAGGTVACFDVDGNPVWSKEVMCVGRSQPFLLHGAVCFIRQKYMPEDGKFGHQHKNLSVDGWTQLTALDLKTGDEKWTSTCGFNMGCHPIPWKLADGRTVILAGRGGGHSPPEKPEGVSLIDGSNGKTLWTLPLPGFMSTMTLNIHGEHALVFHADEHLWVNVQTGKVDRRVSFCKDVSLCSTDADGIVAVGQARYTPAAASLTPKEMKKTRNIIQGSNILVGDWHYFRSYTRPWIGRVHAKTAKVECLQLPLQVVHSDGGKRLFYSADDAIPQKRDYKVGTGITYRSAKVNEVRNSRGLVVMGDPRSKGNGWGHHAAQTPTAIGEFLFVPTLNGTVYVLKSDADELDETAIVAVNDLGPAGQAWTRASISYSDGMLFAHTLKHVICIGQQ